MPIGKLSLAAALLFLAVLIACSGGGGGDSASPPGGTGGTGVANASMIYGRADGYENKELWLHPSDTASPEDPAWLKFPITLVTIDFLTLANRNILSAPWNIQVPVGTYQHIRLIVAGTGDHLTPSASYEIRFRHLNPSTGGFVTDFPLPREPIQLGHYHATAFTLTPTTTNEGRGGCGVVLNVLDYIRGASVTLAPPMGATLAYASLSIPSLSPAIPYCVSGNVIQSNGLDSGYVIASRGGIFVATIGANTRAANNGPYMTANPLGGLPFAFYGVEGFGWSSTAPFANMTPSAPAIADLGNGNVTGIDITMVTLF